MNSRHLFFICVALTLVAVQASATSRSGASVFEQNCAGCHDQAGTHAPAKAALAKLPTKNIVRSLESGVMRIVGTFSLNGPERVAVAEYLTGMPYDPDWRGASSVACGKTTWPNTELFAAPHWNGWGNGPQNLRFQSAGHAKLDAAKIPQLKLQWAFAFPGETIAEAQPTIVDGRLFVGSRSGRAGDR